QEMMQSLLSLLSARFAAIMDEFSCCRASNVWPDLPRRPGVQVEGFDANPRERLVEEERRRDRTSPTPLTLPRRCRTVLHRRFLVRAGLSALPIGAAVALAQVPAPPGPAYQTALRPRHAEVTPTKTKDAQTGGGSIVVEQPEPNTIVVTMAGSAVVGSDF